MPGMTCSICGQAPSVHADYAEQLVRLGIDSISVTPDSFMRVKEHVAAAEAALGSGPAPAPVPPAGGLEAARR